MKAAAKARRQRTRRPPPGFYAELLTAEERARLESPASLDDELYLLRTCVRRLVPRLWAAEGTQDEPKMLQGLARLIQAIASVERARLPGRGGQGGIVDILHKATAGLDPFLKL